ncbi:hypothetical protein AYO21_01507 [Fonsecaea monophora]|uniref:Enoyl reductase (ER) domain-containing protein n=1 Tax=Fonsecaea monophora TaxID=254056 RepID=A0A177FK85_9EURO|nr:hypothetical protein AYO21_01507 [Fonsecaea monophora]KAH0835280.1 Aryl-alcohol dehydrogenase [Fonsecaea pedrosoi]OAG44050.1 hypothetical protein AYO21_01507 [Fonsecaea monophora]
METQIPAVICYPPAAGPDWRAEKVTLSRKVKERELKIRMVATGICHTDIFVSSIPQGVFGVQYPKVVGHEGAGIVEEVGPGVTVASVGDPVLLSYNYCGHCDLCRHGQEVYCLEFAPLNLIGRDDVLKTADGQAVFAQFFGQSSFAMCNIVSEASVVNVRDYVQPGDDALKLLAPLGCGLMTGAGAVLNAARARPHDIILVTGIGAVGLAAIMTAKIIGCKEIIAVDRVPSRLEIAKDLGATKVLDTRALDTAATATLAQELMKLVENQRISVAIETTGAAPVIEGAIGALGKRGRLLQVGVPAPGVNITLPISDMVMFNKVLECHFLGDSTAQVLLPRLLAWWREGRFPLEKIVKRFPPENAVQAMQEMKSGSTIKPILVW